MKAFSYRFEIEFNFHENWRLLAWLVQQLIKFEWIFHHYLPIWCHLFSACTIEFISCILNAISSNINWHIEIWIVFNISNSMNSIYWIHEYGAILCLKLKSHKNRKIGICIERQHNIVTSIKAALPRSVNVFKSSIILLIWRGMIESGKERWR